MDWMKLLAGADWISPTLSILQQGFGGMTQIDATVPGMTGKEVKKHLERYGVRCGTAMVVNDVLLMTVDDPRKAEKALEKVRR